MKLDAHTPTRILVVEDEAAIADIVATALRFHGHSVVTADNGQDALTAALESPFDLIVLDVMVPRLDGLEVCRSLRERGSQVPVIFLTARSDAHDRISGFVAGGDDYLTKPFSVDELVLRVEAILRRSAPNASSRRVSVTNLTLEPDGREVRRDGHRIELSPTEFGLLHYLMVNAGTVVSKAQILANVWDYDYDGGENVVEIYIGYLRRKIDDGREPLIHTQRGVGYVLRQG